MCIYKCVFVCLYKLYNSQSTVEWQLYFSQSGQGEEENRDAFVGAAEGVVVPLSLPRVCHELWVYLAWRDASHSAAGCRCVQPWERPVVACSVVAGAFPSLECSL